MGEKEFFSTGEVSQLLNISRATVSRKFDAGIFYGKKNPITGERLISRESLVTFMRQYNIPLNGMDKTTRKSLLVSSEDENLQNLINTSLADEKKVKVNAVTSGYDALIMCSKTPPDLFIIDNELTDISCQEAVKSLKRQEENADMKIVCCLKNFDEKKLIDIGADDYIIKDSMDNSTITNKVFSLLNIAHTTELSGEKYDHQRRFPRLPVDIPANLELYRVNNPEDRENGNARVDNISIGGAHLSHIHMNKGNIPADTFRFLLEIDEPPLIDWQAECKVVRFQVNGSLTAGIQFVNLSSQNKNKISSIIR